MKKKITWIISIIMIAFLLASCNKQDEGALTQKNNPAEKAGSSSSEAVETKAGQLKSISIDGNLEDWSAADPSAVDALDDAQYGGADIECVYAAKDEENVYIAIKTIGDKPSISFIFNIDNDDHGDYSFNSGITLGSRYSGNV